MKNELNALKDGLFGSGCDWYHGGQGIWLTIYDRCGREPFWKEVDKWKQLCFDKYGMACSNFRTFFIYLCRL